jgi:hypothetical protein
VCCHQPVCLALELISLAMQQSRKKHSVYFTLLNFFHHLATPDWDLLKVK